MATHSSTLAWKIPWTEEPGGLRSMGLLRVGHDQATSLSLFTFMHWRKDMATHSSVLAWRIRRTAEPGGLTSMGSHRVGHDQSDLAAAAAGCIKFLLQISEKQLFCLCFFQYKQSMFCLFLQKFLLLDETSQCYPQLPSDGRTIVDVQAFTASWEKVRNLPFQNHDC